MKKILIFLLVLSILASFGCTSNEPIIPPDTAESPETTSAPETTAVPISPSTPEPTINARSWYTTYNKDNDVCFLYLDLSNTDKKITIIDYDLATKQLNEYTGKYEERRGQEITAAFDDKKLTFTIKDTERINEKAVILTACDIEEYKHLLGKELTFGAGAAIPDTSPSAKTKKYEFTFTEVINGINSETDERTTLKKPVSLTINIPETWKHSSNIIFDDSVRKNAGFYLDKRAELSPYLYKLPDDMKWDESTFERMSNMFAGHKATPFTTTSGYNAVEYSANHFQNMPDSKYVYYQYLIQVSDEYAAYLSLMMFDLTDKGTVDPRDIANSITAYIPIDVPIEVPVTNLDAPTGENVYREHIHNLLDKALVAPDGDYLTTIKRNSALGSRDTTYLLSLRNGIITISETAYQEYHEYVTVFNTREQYKGSYSTSKTGIVYANFGKETWTFALIPFEGKLYLQRISGTMPAQDGPHSWVSYDIFTYTPLAIVKPDKEMRESTNPDSNYGTWYSFFDDEYCTMTIMNGGSGQSPDYCIDFSYGKYEKKTIADQYTTWTSKYDEDNIHEGEFGRVKDSVLYTFNYKAKAEKDGDTIKLTILECDENDLSTLVGKTLIFTRDSMPINNPVSSEQKSITLTAANSMTFLDIDLYGKAEKTPLTDPVTLTMTLPADFEVTGGDTVYLFPSDMPFDGDELAVIGGLFGSSLGTMANTGKVFTTKEGYSAVEIDNNYLVRISDTQAIRFHIETNGYAGSMHYEISNGTFYVRDIVDTLKVSR